MIIFAAWPTASVFKSNNNVARWQNAGYKVAVATDLPRTAIKAIDASVPPLIIKKYEGYYRCMNALTKALVMTYRADIVVCAGDGIHPPAYKAHDLAAAFAAKFNNGFGVMQPVQGSWHSERMQAGTQPWSQHRMHQTRPTHERCESPWLGRTFIMEANSGMGPYCEKYDQYFGDHELHDVAREMGCLWKQPNLCQPNQHWSKTGGPDIADYQVKNFERSYEKDWATYRARRDSQFPAAVVADMGLGANIGRIIT